jgi:predicted lipid-binding transport protein (Tim44 family)
MSRISDFLITYGLYGLSGGMIGLFLAGLYGFLFDASTPYIIAALVVFMSIACLIIGALIEANRKAMEAERARDRWRRG